MNADDTRVPVSGSTLRKIAAALSLLKQSPVALVGAGLILFWVLMAIFAPLVAPFDPVQQIKPFLPPAPLTARVGSFSSARTNSAAMSSAVWSMAAGRCSPTA